MRMTPFTTLISVSALAARMERPHLAVIDCRFSLADKEAGRRDYETAHIPGAHYADLERDLSGAVAGGGGGRHPLPDAAEFARRLRRWRIAPRSQVAVYDHGDGAIAARLWWMLRAFGHEHVALLDGGYRAWRQAGMEVTRETPRAGDDAIDDGADSPRVFDAAQILDADAVAAQLAARKITLVDARAPARFRGEHEPLDARAGHVPGAVNFPYAKNLDARGFFLPSEKLAARFAELAPQKVVHMCGSGVTACHNILAMEIAGLRGARLYPGSWSDWSRDPARAIATGNDGGNSLSAAS
ncbi:MAG: putative 3-mercaptopyruvate sulfurtransferase [Arenicellales bacterium IbO2]|nr:sulfurtransferase [Gammaproteobacteria bacterium]CAJ2376056.1 MAG: putative 3-mercaptopyruvate sulfurtransferase [Arenicellales bacterium IbO2]